MNDFLVIAPLFKLAYALIAIVAAVEVSRWLDRRAGRPFGKVAAIVGKSPIASAIYYGLRILAIMSLLGAVMGCSPAAAATDKYDRQIARAVAMYWPAYPFPVAWKAQLYQESRLDPDAVSPVGAAGLAQFMPGTWRQVVRELRYPPGISPHHDIAIDAGAYYMAKLHRQWSAPRSWDDRHKLAQASYNAGLGHVLAAQKRCGGPPGYPEIIRCLPDVTGRHAMETITYVERIARWVRMFTAQGG